MEHPQTNQTTDSWPTGKIIKLIMFPRPKDAPPSGKKEKRLRILVGGIFGVLAVLIFRSM